MKKAGFLGATLATMLLLSLHSNAQFEEGQSDINAGIGFVAFGLEGETGVPPVSLSYEYGITDNIGVGAFVGYTSSTTDFGFFGNSAEINFTYMMFAARGSYHFELIDDFDTYAGVMIGYNNASVDYGDTDFGGLEQPSFDVGGVLYGFYAGGRYHFTDNIGAFLEIGYGISAVNLGLAFKF